MAFPVPTSFSGAQLMAGLLLPLGIAFCLLVIKRLRQERKKLALWEKGSAYIIKLQCEKNSEEVPISMSVRYKYEHNKKVYECEKVILSDYIDRNNDWKASYFSNKEGTYYSVYEDLLRAQKGNSPFTVWVNTQKPYQAIIIYPKTAGVEKFVWALIGISSYFIYYIFSRDSW